MPPDRLAFLIRARELRAAQRAGLAAAPGDISQRELAARLGMSPATLRKLEQTAIAKLRDGFARRGLSLKTIRELIATPSDSSSV